MNDYYMMMCNVESEEKSGTHWLDEYIEEQEENRLIISSFNVSDTPEIDEYWENYRKNSTQQYQYEEF